MKQDVRAAKSAARVASGGFTFEMETNSRYTEILELAKRMDKLGIPYELKPCYDGWELLYPTAANVIMDAVSHMMVNHARNAIEVLGIGEYHPPVYENQTAAEAIRFFYVHYKMNRREVDRLLPPRPIKAEFYDIETQEYVSKEQLRQEFKEAKAADVRDEHGHKFLSFPQWLNNCMTYNNGTLIHVTA